jgi:hypothetical protein
MAKIVRNRRIKRSKAYNKIKRRDHCRLRHQADFSTTEDSIFMLFDVNTWHLASRGYVSDVERNT